MEWACSNPAPRGRTRGSISLLDTLGHPGILVNRKWRRGIQDSPKWGRYTQCNREWGTDTRGSPSSNFVPNLSMVDPWSGGTPGNKCPRSTGGDSKWDLRRHT